MLMLAVRPTAPNDCTLERAALAMPVDCTQRIPVAEWTACEMPAERAQLMFPTPDALATPQLHPPRTAPGMTGRPPRPKLNARRIKEGRGTGRSAVATTGGSLGVSGTSLT